ncbi:MAG: type I-C CRISPR-associated protein Cas8c/Csd1 [Bacteroidaceae bacterium]|nr:type I-C CRISPR-associated protein Cas8c/Csd1 [Bacteroidaceae bacterium]
MILRALYDYYHRCGNLPAFGMELKQIGFIIVINKKGKFLRFEDRRIDSRSAQLFLVKKSVGRSSAPVANYLYDNSQYVFGYSEKGDMKSMRKYFDTFKDKIQEIYEAAPNNEDMKAVHAFYEQEPVHIVEEMQKDPLWDDIAKNLNKKYSTFSFLIEGDVEIMASKRNITNLLDTEENAGKNICLVTGNLATNVETTTATMIPGSQATAKLVSFQVKSGYDSYGKEKGNNASISEEAEFAYTTALNHLLRADSHNKFMVGTRTFLFWASSDSEAAKASEENLFAFFGKADDVDDPNRRVEMVKQTFLSIYNGKLPSEKDDKFYILGLAPNAARIAVVYWAELPLCEFAHTISRHFEDMEIVDTRKEKKPYSGLHAILGAATLGGKSSDASPNLPDAVVKSIFQGLPYPQTLFASVIRRIRAEQDITPYGIPCRVATIKGYLNRLNDNNKKINIMLDKENNNLGYLCGRLFAVLDKIQQDANHINSIQERYMNAASATPAAVFATILNLSTHHSEKLNAGAKIFYEKLKQEIIDKLPADGFPAHLDLQDQGRFFVGFYHQRQDFYTKNEESVTE